jgi:hypothetical protein
MQVTITIPQNIIDVLTERGWDKEEVAILFKTFVEQSSMGLEIDFCEWVEDQDEEQLGDLFRKEQQLEVGMEVEIVKQVGKNSNNEVGDVGIITEVHGTAYRVQVEGRKDYGNWQDKTEISRVNY